MILKILLPFGIFAEETNVLRVVVDTHLGSMGILPHRLDCVASLTPGILVYETALEGETYIAIDEGILVKAGKDVLISVRNAIRGTDLAELHAAVEREFMTLNEQESKVRSVMARMESGLMHRLVEFHHE